MSNLDRLASKKRFWQFLIVAFLGSAYLIALLPGPGYSGDTAKFQFVGHILGTPHTTGYPTYVILNFIFTTIFPFGTLAFKANLLSAIFSVSASLVLFSILNRLEVDMITSFTTTITFGFGYTVWSQSLIAEVYSLNLLFTALVLYLFIGWHNEKKENLLYAACGLYALSFGNHLTMITFLPAIVYLVWVTEKMVFADPKKIGIVISLIVLGAAQYLYVFWRTNNPGTQYLEMSAPDVKTFWRSVTGGQFGHLLFGLPLRWMVLERLPALLLFILRELMFILPFTIVGFTSIKTKNLSAFLFLALAGNSLFCMGYAIYDIFVYLIPAYFVLALFSGRGLQILSDVLKIRIPVVRPLLLTIPAMFVLMNFRSVDQHDNVADNQKALDILKTVQKDAIVACPDYHYAMILWYHILTEDWKNKNIHVVFYHDQRIPSREISNYLWWQKSFYIPVTQDSVPTGLSAYLFLGSFDVRPHQPLGLSKKESRESRKPSDAMLSQLKPSFEFRGVQVKEVRSDLCLLTKKP